MVVLSVESIGEERFVRGMNRYVQEMKDFREVFLQIQQDFYEINERNFARNGYPVKFTPAQNERYIAWKRSRVGHNIPLVLYGRLRNSATGKNQADAQDTVVDIRRTSAEFATRVPYALHHYYDRNSKAVQLTKEDKTRWARMFQTWAYQKWREEIGEMRFRQRG